MAAGFEALCRLVKRYMGGGVDWEPPVGNHSRVSTWGLPLKTRPCQVG